MSREPEQAVTLTRWTCRAHTVYMNDIWYCLCDSLDSAERIVAALNAQAARAARPASGEPERASVREADAILERVAKMCDFAVAHEKSLSPDHRLDGMEMASGLASSVRALKGTFILIGQPAPRPDALTLADRITQYLASGGLFNPEQMEHEKVRNLLIDCREALLAAPRAEEGQGR